VSRDSSEPEVDLTALAERDARLPGLALACRSGCPSARADPAGLDYKILRHGERVLGFSVGGRMVLILVISRWSPPSTVARTPRPSGVRACFLTRPSIWQIPALGVAHPTKVPRGDARRGSVLAHMRFGFFVVIMFGQSAIDIRDQEIGLILGVLPWWAHWTRSEMETQFALDPALKLYRSLLPDLRIGGGAHDPLTRMYARALSAKPSRRRRVLFAGRCCVFSQPGFDLARYGLSARHGPAGPERVWVREG